MKNYFFTNRTLCGILDEMRKMYETRNFSALLGLIEEAQIAGNKMESAIGDLKDIREINEKRAKLKKKYRKLKAKVEKLEPEDENK